MGRLAQQRAHLRQCPSQATSVSLTWDWLCMCPRARPSRAVWALWATWVSPFDLIQQPGSWIPLLPRDWPAHCCAVGISSPLVVDSPHQHQDCCCFVTWETKT